MNDGSTEYGRRSLSVGTLVVWPVQQPLLLDPPSPLSFISMVPPRHHILTSSDSLEELGGAGLAPDPHCTTFPFLKISGLQTRKAFQVIASPDIWESE